ncbi:YceI family protein [Piscinibacter sakaiensis]|uniref:Putative signal peptide protein n=1 Tax=Piscinibacter sakaiensis TaxID=1547922 RepID=A0A0K8P1S9_PISS1|nr:YceI family protein [Piscinibacter sakaiensis]GAP36494.1 putative signal peptide protein [Piscinibacter sakaiensis]
MNLKPFVLAALVATAGLAQAQSATYAIDPTHTTVIFEAKHFGTSTNRGRFDRKSGTITLDKAARTGRAEITIETASINTGVAPFDNHLRSKDFFKTDEFPTARFVGDRFSFDAAGKLSSVAGELTFLGKTRPVTLTAQNYACYDNPMLNREVCGGDFETTIQRSQFGSDYGLPAIPDSVRLLIQVEAIKQ